MARGGKREGAGRPVGSNLNPKFQFALWLLVELERDGGPDSAHRLDLSSAINGAIADLNEMFAKSNPPLPNIDWSERTVRRWYGFIDKRLANDADAIQTLEKLRAWRRQTNWKHRPVDILVEVLSMNLSKFIV